MPTLFMFYIKLCSYLCVCVLVSIVTEPDFSYLDALAPYQPLAMKCVYCPIDTRLNFHQVSKLLKEVQVGPLWLLNPTDSPAGNTE